MAVVGRRLVTSTALLTTLLAGAGLPATATERAEVGRNVSPAVRQAAVPAVAGAGDVVADTGPREVRDFRMLGAEWSGTGEASLEARVRADGEWGGWQPLPASADAAGATTRTDPLWVDRADGYQVRAHGDRAPEGLRVLLVDPGADGAARTTALATAAPTLAAGNVAAPQVVTRAQWGADESRTTTCSAGTYAATVRMAFVHHTVHTATGANDYTADQAPAIVRSIYEYDTSGAAPYCDLSYNALVDRFGTVYEGRRGGLDLPVIGGHTAGHNTDTFGVAVIGNFEGTDPSAVPPPAAVDGLTGLLAWKLALGYRDPQGTAVLAADPDTTYPVISGHLDSSTASTKCPGSNLYALLPQVRQAVADRIGSYDSPVYRKWQALGGEAGFAGSPFRGETAKGSATYAQFTGADVWWTADTGAHEVHGPIRSEYRRFSAGSSRLGVPTSDQRAGSRSGTTYNVFSGGRIYASATTGARALYGPVLTRYKLLGYDASRLRLPTTGIKPGKRSGATFAAFQGGRVYASARTGARPVWGPILTRYQKLGYDGSRLRLPTGGEVSVTGGTRQRFQGGTIRWYRASNTTKVFYG